MTLSVWRYSHLALAVSSFLFILLASVTGIILAFEPVTEQMQLPASSSAEEVRLSDALEVMQAGYPEILELRTDHNQRLIATVFTEEGDMIEGYFDPVSGAYLGEIPGQSDFFKWITSLHRSLFLKGLGRFFVGLSAFLLFLIAFTGTLLIIRRQTGLRKFFSRVTFENFSQYYHIVLGRLTLLPILLITLTGVFLSLEQFNMLPEYFPEHQVDTDSLVEGAHRDVTAFTVFENTRLTEVRALEFPFSGDVADMFSLELKDRELKIHQYNGAVLSEQVYPVYKVFSAWSTKWHTGRGQILWSLILAVSAANILFFIWSGFRMTLRRRKVRIRNRYTAGEAEVVILTGSETGTTTQFAQVLYKELIKADKKVYLTEMNRYREFPSMKHLLVLTATYGKGEAPSGATEFLSLLKTVKQEREVQFSVVGFGSYAYPDFCKYAYDADRELGRHFTRLIPAFTISDRSYESFDHWAQTWSRTTGIGIELPEKGPELRMPPLKKYKVIYRSEAEKDPENTFVIKLKPLRWQRFESGDLLAINPNGQPRERYYSIGRKGRQIQLSVKRHTNGFGSGYLNTLEHGDIVKGRIVVKDDFHFPEKAPGVIMVANGTGVGPFLGMISGNTKGIPVELYLGLRTANSYELYREQLEEGLNRENLRKIHLALSKEGSRKYVQDLLQEKEEEVAFLLRRGGVIMICGSVRMTQGVTESLEQICRKHNNSPVSRYIQKGQIKTDSY